MAVTRDDRYLTDAQGRALAGAAVYYCTQPANTTTIPPSPLAVVYTNLTGTVGVNPIITDGFGHSVAYLDNTVFYTLVFVHPLFGSSPVVLIDQLVGGVGGGGSNTVTFAGTPSGTINGINTAFTFSVPVSPSLTTVWKNFPLVPGLGYTSSWAGGVLTVTYASAPIVGDTLYAQGQYNV
jgi:hypothetical protein